MAENVVGIDFVARLDAFRADLAKIPDIGGTEAKALTAQLSREIKKAEKAARDVGKASKAAKGDVDGLAKGFKGLGQASGFPVEKIEHLSAGLSALANPVGAAVAAIALLAAGAVALGAGVVKAAYDAAALHEELADFGDVDGFLPEITPQQLVSMKAAHAAVDALGTVAKATALTIGAEFAPILEGLATQALATGLAVKDLVSYGIELVREMNTWYDGLSTAGKVALNVATNGMAGLVFEMDDLAAGANDATGAWGDYIAQAKDLIGVQVQVEAKTKKTTKATDDAAKAASDYANAVKDLAAIQSSQTMSTLDGLARLDAEYAEVYERIGVAQDKAVLSAGANQDKITAAFVAGNEARRASDAAHAADKQKLDDASAASAEAHFKEDQKREQDRVKAREEAAAKVADASFSAANDLAGAIGDVADAVQENAEKQGKAGEKLAKRAFAISQAAAIASTIVTTAEAAMRAYNAALALGPPGLILAPIAAGVAGAAGAVQLATIAAQPPPKFHSGLAPDEYPATLQRGEGVLSTRGVRAMGGPEAVKAANAGAAPAMGQTVVVQNTYRHRVFDTFVADNLKQPTSTLHGAVRKGGSGGRRRRV